MKSLKSVTKNYLEDFIDFSFNGHRASDFGLVRVSDGSRLNLSLLPPIQDKSTPVPGGDGNYLFGANYTSRQFPIKVAYDHLTEGDLIKLRKWLNSKESGELIFGERPYVAWDAKITGQPQLTLIPFTEKIDGKKVRIYKGEGTLTFIAHFPYGHNPKGKKWLSDYNKDYDLTNAEWADGSGLINKGDYDNFIGSPSTAKVYNGGDVPTDFLFRFRIRGGQKGYVSLTHSTNKNISKKIEIQNLTPSDMSIQMNSKLHLLEGVDAEGKIDGKVYNNFIVGGDFFKIPNKEEGDMGDYQLSISENIAAEKLEYGYYYL